MKRKELNKLLGEYKEQLREIGEILDFLRGRDSSDAQKRPYREGRLLELIYSLPAVLQSRCLKEYEKAVEMPIIR
jgi:hypothetical protein